MPFISVLSQLFFVSFIRFLVLKAHRKQLSAMRNLALFKEPASSAQQTRFLHRPHLLAQDSIVGISRTQLMS